MLARNTLLNLLGHAAPLAAALLAVPYLVAHLDPSRFGFLSLAWVLVGYFSLFDLGLGRALSRLVAERTGTPRETELPVLTKTALTLTFALGAFAGLILFITSSWICTNLLNLPMALQSEATNALRILALSLPLVTLTAALRGLMEAGQYFGWVNIIRIGLGVLTFAGPMATAAGTSSLVVMAVVLAVLRAAGLIAHWAICLRLYPTFTRIGIPDGAAALEMAGFGAWLTVSNIAGPLMVYLDRFVIAGTLAVATVGYYTAPYEVVTRLWLIPAALTGVLFPAFAAASPERALLLYRAGLNSVILTVFPLVLAAVLYAPEWLRLWLNTDYAANSARVAQVLSLGVALNCVAYIPFTLLQSHGRSDLTAKLHLAELPPYLLTLVWAVSTFGILGAALAWAGRCAVDTLAMFVLAHRHSRIRVSLFGTSQWLTLVLILGLLAAALAPEQASTKAAYLVFCITLFPLLSWHVLLSPQERAYAKRLAARTLEICDR